MYILDSLINSPNPNLQSIDACMNQNTANGNGLCGFSAALNPTLRKLIAYGSDSLNATDSTLTLAIGLQCVEEYGRPVYLARAIHVYFNPFVDWPHCENPETRPLASKQEDRTQNESVENSSAIKVYPNPAREQLRIEGMEANCSITLYSASGQLVLQQRVVDKAVSELNISKLARGMYLLRITDSKGELLKQESISLQ